MIIHFILHIYANKFIINLFKSEFINIDFNIITYSTSLCERKYLFNDSFLFVYVCANLDELRHAEKMNIGQNIYHDEFNRLHFLKKFNTKLINVLFSDSRQTYNFSNSFKKDHIYAKDPKERSYILLPSQHQILIGSLFGEKFKKPNFLKILFKEFVSVKTKILLVIKLRHKLSNLNSGFNTKINFNSQPILIDPYPYIFC